MKKILIMGLPGSGKTTLARDLSYELNADWINADKIRKKYKDWDFSKNGVLRQSKRMRDIANKSKNKFVVADFVCPFAEGRKIFKPNYLIWMNTVKKGRLSTFDKSFEKPKNYNYSVNEKNSKLWAIKIADKLQKYKWDNKKKTSQMLGRYQPFHDGHLKLFEKILVKYGQVCIQVKDVNGIDDNPFNFKKVKSIIDKKLYNLYKNRYKIMLAPNIAKICYGRKVGYEFEQIKLSNKIHAISATKIRKKMRREGKLKRNVRH
tara:strand:- start:6296 stop:7081 length:786 start_codon:yes stop_codon:yes gene_type:complete